MDVFIASLEEGLVNELFALYLLHGHGDRWLMAGTIAAECKNGFDALAQAFAGGERPKAVQPEDYMPTYHAAGESPPRQRAAEPGWIPADSDAALRRMKRMAGF